MRVNQTGVARPVTNLQCFLRTIAEEYNDVRTIIPDGIYGVETSRSVESFQKKFGLPQTGETDNDTWDRVVQEYDIVIKRNKAPNAMQPFSYVEGEIRFGDTGDAVYFVQIMINTIGGHYSNIGALDLTGTYDAPTQREVRTLQPIGHLPATGNVDKETWNMITDLYHSVRAEQSRRQPQQSDAPPNTDHPDSQTKPCTTCQD